MSIVLEKKIYKVVNSMIDISKLPEEERKIIIARREYKRAWNRANPDKVKEHQRRYWKKKYDRTHGTGEKIA